MSAVRRRRCARPKSQEGTLVSLEVMPEPGYRVQSYTGDCVDGTANMTQARNCGVVLVKGDGPSLAATPRTAPPPATAPGAPRVARNEPPSGSNQPRPDQTVAVAPPQPPTSSAPPEKAPQRTEVASPGEPPPAARPPRLPPGGPRHRMRRQLPRELPEGGKATARPRRSLPTPTSSECSRHTAARTSAWTSRA